MQKNNNKVNKFINKYNESYWSKFSLKSTKAEQMSRNKIIINSNSVKQY